MKTELTVKDIVEITNGKLIIGAKEEVCNNFSFDIREISKEDTFVGIKGDASDTSELWKDALDQGAKVAIVENIAVVNAKVGINTKPVGMFAGRIYSSDTTIKNCLVVDTSLSKQAGLSAWFENIGGSAAKALFINNYAITPNNYAACDTVSGTISSGYADYKVVSTYTDMLSEVGSNVKVFTCLEFDGDDVLIAGVKINENMQFTDIVADFEKGVENTLTSTIIANETVNKVTISDTEVAFTQDGDTLTFSATALAKAPISDGLEMLIYTDAKTYICKANVSIDAPVMNTKLKEVPVICVGDMVDNAFTVDLPLETSTITQIGNFNRIVIYDSPTIATTYLCNSRSF